jgi:hypothetical protein
MMTKFPKPLARVVELHLEPRFVGSSGRFDSRLGHVSMPQQSTGPGHPSATTREAGTSPKGNGATSGDVLRLKSKRHQPAGCAVQ